MAKKLNLGSLSPSWSFWIDAAVDKKGAIAFNASHPLSPTELYYLSSPGAQPRRLTDFNKEVRSMARGKSAMAGAAVTDWVDQYNLGDANVNRGNAIGGSPWVGDNMKLYIDQSPITMAHRITAPTLILANTADPSVPGSQSYKLYHELKDNGVPTKFIAWPVPAHNASDPVRQNGSKPAVD